MITRRREGTHEVGNDAANFKRVGDHHMNASRRVITVGMTALIVLGAGCSEDDKGGSAKTTAAAGASIDVGLSEFAITLSATEVASGPITFNATNNGTMQHEMVVVRTDLDSGALPVTGDRVPEEEVDAVDEIAEFTQQTTESATIELTPGKYVIICNLPAHYGQGMHVALTVKD